MMETYASRTLCLLILAFSMLACTDESEGEDPVVDEEGARALDASDFRTCALTVDGRAYCWGHTGWGALGIEPIETVIHPRPAEVRDAPVFASIAAGRDHTCALTAGGDAFCWGSNTDGQLGDGTVDLDESPEPRRVEGGLAFTSIGAGTSHTCALSTEGQVYCWGNTSSGRLGDGVVRWGDSESAPVAIAGEHTFALLSVGESHNCAITTDDELYCWGSNATAQLGDGTFDDRWEPVRIAEEEAFQEVSAGSDNTCAIATDGVTYCWGDGRYGQLGDGGATFERVEQSPVQVEAGQDFTAISVGRTFVCGLTAEQRAYCWGDNIAGQLGQRPEAVDEECQGLPCATLPVAVSGDHLFVDITAGGAHTCGLTPDERVFCWGNNENGALGRGTVDFEVHATPQPVIDDLPFGRPE